MREFSVPVSIHGLRQTVTPNSTISVKLFWLVCFLAISTFGIRQIYVTVSTFLLYQTKTKLENLEYEHIPFPAITLCPGSVYRKSMVGKTDHLYTGTYLSIYGGYDQLSEASKSSKSLCESTLALKKFSINWNNPMADFRQIFFDSEKTVMECQFNRKPLNCTRLFLNHQAELGWCFTFNVGEDLLRHFFIEGESLITTNSYGTTAKEKQVFPMRSGLQNSLSFTINVNASDSCIPVGQYFAGFVVYVHDPNIQPFLTTKPLVLLTPGFSTKIGISVKNIRRNTENLGLCQSQIRLKWYPNMTKYTFRDAYIVDCMMSLVFEKCNCFPFFAPVYAPYVVYVKWEQKLCGSTPETLHEAICVNSVMKQEYTETHECHSNVPVPCEETKITAHPVSTVYPPNALVPSLLKNFNLSPTTTRNEFRLNFLSATFYLKDRKMAFIQVDRKMTWVDLLNQFGGTIGMCLGMSFMSFMELMTLFCTGIINKMLRFQNEVNRNGSFLKFKYLS